MSSQQVQILTPLEEFTTLYVSASHSRFEASWYILWSILLRSNFGRPETFQPHRNQNVKRSVFPVILMQYPHLASNIDLEEIAEDSQEPEDADFSTIYNLSDLTYDPTNDSGATSTSLYEHGSPSDSVLFCDTFSHLSFEPQAASFPPVGIESATGIVQPHSQHHAESLSVLVNPQSASQARVLRRHSQISEHEVNQALEILRKAKAIPSRRVPDFSRVLYVEDGGQNYVFERFDLIVELKATSASDERDNKFGYAWEQVKEQALFVFSGNPDIEKLVGIVGIGDRWQCREISRGEDGKAISLSLIPSVEQYMIKEGIRGLEYVSLRSRHSVKVFSFINQHLEKINERDIWTRARGKAGSGTLDHEACNSWQLQFVKKMQDRALPDELLDVEE